MQIYPSEFGLKRLKEEEINGPTELVADCTSDLDEEVCIDSFFPFFFLLFMTFLLSVTICIYIISPE